MTRIVGIVGCGLLAASIASPAAAQVLLYSNSTPPPGLSTGPTTDSGVAAPAGTTWSECQHPTGDTTQANTSAGFTVQNTAFRLADDFTVPAGGWQVDFVDIYAYQTGSPPTPSPFVTAVIQIWGPCTPGTRPGDAGCTTIAFGDTTTNRLVSSVDATMFRIFNTVAPPPGTAPGTTRKIWQNRISVNTVLLPGLYWVEYGTTVSNAGAHFAPSITLPGIRGLAGWNARQFNVAGGTWADVIDTGNPASAPDFPQDMPFEIYGTAVPVELMDFRIE